MCGWKIDDLRREKSVEWRSAWAENEKKTCAAGCTVAFKPSGHAPYTSALFSELFPRYVDADVVRIVNDAVPAAVPETNKVHLACLASSRAP